MKIKTNLRFYPIPVRMTKTDKIVDNKCWRGRGEVVFQFLSLYPSLRNLLKMKTIPYLLLTTPVVSHHT